MGGEKWKGFLRFWKCALDNNGEDENFFEGDAERILPAKLYLPGLLADTQFGNRMKNAVHRIVLWITTCRPQKKVRIVRPITTIFFAPRCTPHRNCAADNNPARRKLCGGFQRRLPEIVCRITTCIKEAARQTVPPITIQPVENCAADSNPRCPAPAENVRRITTPSAAEKNAAGVGTNGTV